MSRQKEDQLVRQKRKEMKAKRAACQKGPTCDYCERTGLCIDETSLREQSIKIYPGKSPSGIVGPTDTVTETLQPPEIPPSYKLRNLR